MEKEISHTLEVSAAGAELGDRWDRYVEAHGASSLCHLFAWRTIVEKSYRLEATFLVAEGGRGRIEGVLPYGEGARPRRERLPWCRCLSSTKEASLPTRRRSPRR